MMTRAVLTVVLASQVSALWAAPWFAWIFRRELAPPDMPSLGDVRGLPER
jgi:hypothetical protein